VGVVWRLGLGLNSSSPQTSDRSAIIHSTIQRANRSARLKTELKMFNWHLKTQPFKIKANPIHQWPCENSSHQRTECVWISTSLREVTSMRTTVLPKSHGGNVRFVTRWCVSKAPGISCLMDNLLSVPVQTILTETGKPTHSEVCKTHLQKLCCYLRVCIFLCCQVANLRYAEFNIRFKWLVRCWLNGENSRNTRSW